MADEIPASNFDFNTVLSQPLENYVFALFSLIIGYIIVRYISMSIEKFAERNSQIPSLMLLHLLRAFRLFLYIIVILIAVSFLGINVNTLIISISAFLAVVLGFGMKDTVNNVASGVWIAASRAYDLEDEVTIAGESGTVKNMSIMSTEIKQLDNTRVLVPNGKVWNSAIINVTRMPTRMIVIVYGVGYDTNIKEAVQVALDVVDKHPKIHKDPQPIVRFREMGESSVDLQLRAWVDTDDYYPVKSEVLANLFEALNEANIDIPYPHIQVVTSE